MAVEASDKPRWRIRRRRAVAIILTLAIEALILLGLLVLSNGEEPARKGQRDLVVVSLAAPKAQSETAKASPKPAQAARPVREPPIPVPVRPHEKPAIVVLSKEDFAASDIGKLAKSGSGTGKPAYGPGDGPGGQTLYPADWYREPPRGVLAEALPNGAPEGAWAMIACRTIERYRVDNCVALGESHVGLALALRKSAWQFQVLPPRVNGRAQVGAWVRIRFDFTEKAEN